MSVTVNQWYLCCKPVGGKADLEGLGDGSPPDSLDAPGPPLGPRGETPGSKVPEKLKNFY